ncbi:alpha-glucoside-specific PTS transporter subunit IIBC [Lachnospiraceae bacterium 29-91]|nr:PTS system, alpha-glucoside-specific IIBC component [Lachnospiraceae bacterium M18-1]
MKGVMQKVQRFGGAMFTPVLLFSFAGIMVGLSTLFLNASIFGSMAAEGHFWYQIWYMIQEGAWMVFRQMPLLFVIGLPIGLAKKQNARCVLEAFVIYVTFNYFLAAVLQFWGSFFGVDYTAEVGGTSGLASICGIKSLDTGMFGALIIAGIVVWIHNRYFDKELPDWLGIFSGSSFVVIIGFFVMIPVAFIFAGLWPKVQAAIYMLQDFFKASGTVGVGLYAFCEKILLPTGLHHFIYAPFTLDSAVVPGGIEAYWALHLSEFADSTVPLKELFPAGGFELFGNAKVFAPIGITLAFYSTAKKEKRKQVLALMIPAALTAMLTGITEPIEFTFLFIAPVLFVVHALLCACINAVMYAVGVSGAFGNGLIAWLSLNWIPCGKNHWQTYVIQVIVGLAFSLIWFFVFRFLIKKFNFLTPGREEDGEDARLYTKKDYREKQAGGGELGYAAQILAFLGGKDNIIDVTNCATRLRVNVKDASRVRPEIEFKKIGAHGLSKNGTAIQVIVGLKVPKVRDQFEECMAKNILPTEYADAAEKNDVNDTTERKVQKTEKRCLYAAQTGTAIPLEKVPDDVFSQKVMGEGVAVIPDDTLVVAPAAGEVAVVAETKHAYAIVAEDGTEILIHIGLETVNLQGKGFEALVKPGDKVQIGTPLCKVDESLVKGETPLYTPMIITNADEVANLKCRTGKAAAGKDYIIEYEK